MNVLAFRRQREWWIWLLPPVVFVAVRELHVARLERLSAALLGVAVVIVAMRRPGRALVVLFALLPFHQLGLALLYRIGLPAELVRPLGNWKELLLAGVVLAGLNAWLQGGTRLDALDKLAVAYVVLVSIYFLFPELVNPPGFFDPGAPTDRYVQLLAWRVDTLFLIAFLGARHAPLGDVRPRVTQAILVVGTIAAAMAMVEFVAPGVWDWIAIEVCQVNRYRVQVVGVQPFDYGTVVIRDLVAGREVVRAGSLLLSPLSLGFYLLLPFAVAVQQLLRPRPGLWGLPCAAVLAGGLLVTFTRSAILGAIVVCFVALRARRSGAPARRARLALILAAAIVIAVPVAARTGLGARTSTALENQGSTADHLRGLTTGVKTMIDEPLGLGLGTQPGVGDRFATATKLTSENAYLQIANELGVVALGLFVALLVLLLRRLRVAASESDDDPMAGAWHSAAVALVVGGMFLHIWNDFTMAWSFWAGAGIVLGLTTRAGAALKVVSSA